MDLEKKSFKGIRQVSLANYKACSEKEGYLWFVKDGQKRNIYFGSQLYADLDSESSDEKIQEKINEALDELISQDLLHSFDEDGKLKNEITFEVVDDEKGNPILHLKGKDSADVATLDMSQFVVDGMLDDVEFNSETHDLIFTFNTDAGEKTITVDLTDLVDVYTAGNGVEVSDKGEISLKLAEDTQKFLTLDENGLKLANVDGSNIEIGVAIHDGENKDIIDKNANVTSVLQTIFDTISDIKAEALSVEGDGKSIEATDDVEKPTKKIVSLKVEESTTDTVNNGHIEIIKSENGVYGQMYYMSNVESVSGEITDGTINGESVSVYGATVANDVRLKVTATEDVEIEDVTLSGDFPRTTSNAIVTLNGGTSVVINNMTYGETVTGYNALELGLSSDDKYKKIDITNCNFNGVMSNNAILIFGTDDNAVVNIKNCHFHQLSNCLRLSNKFNAKNVVVNVTDCSVDQWDTNPTWEGFLICEDYTSKSVEAEQANNLFGDGKITVNFTNLTYQGEKVLSETPNRVTYVYNDYGAAVTDEKYLPIVTFK